MLWAAQLDSLHLWAYSSTYGRFFGSSVMKRILTRFSNDVCETLGIAFAKKIAIHLETR